MKNFGIGLGLGLLGFFLWFGFSVMVALGNVVDLKPELWLTALQTGSFVLMIGGPVVFWIIRPVVTLIERRKG